jgi:hypothetical protein
MEEGKEWKDTLKEKTYTPPILILADNDTTSLRRLLARNRLRAANSLWSLDLVTTFSAKGSASRKRRVLSASLLGTNKDLEIGAISFLRISKIMTKECRQGGCVIRGSNMRRLMI